MSFLIKHGLLEIKGMLIHSFIHRAHLFSIDVVNINVPSMSEGIISSCALRKIILLSIEGMLIIIHHSSFFIHHLSLLSLMFL